MRLYEISAAYRAVMEQVDEADGVVEGSLEKQLDALGGALVDKVEACGVVMTEQDAEAEALDREIKRLQARKRAVEGGRERLAEYVRRCLVEAGERKVKGPRLTVSLRASTSVQVTVEAAALPEGMRRTKSVVEPDKGAIKAALERGEAVEGCALVTRDSVVLR